MFQREHKIFTIKSYYSNVNRGENGNLMQNSVRWCSLLTPVFAYNPRLTKGVTPSTVAKRLARHITFGRSRVLTPVPPDQVWVFFRAFPTPSHRGISHITDKANAGSVSTSAPILAVPIPNLPVSMAEILQDDGNRLLESVPRRINE
jgi:hypothetical protein